MRPFAPLLLVAGCAKGEPKDDGATNGPDPTWSLVADGMEGGVLLSAWSDGEALQIVGGDLGEGPGVLLTLQGDTLCVTPQVTERTLWWIHGSTAGEWYAVGELGTVLRSVDGVLTREDLPTEATLFGVWAEGDTVWAAGGHVGSGENTGEIWVRQDGTWTALRTDLPGVVFKVWRGWFVGQDYVWRLEGDTLVEERVDARLLTVRGRSDDDVWAVGGITGPVALHWDDGQVEDIDTSIFNEALNGVWTEEGEDVWVAGNYGVTARWDGEEWHHPDSPVTLEHLHAVWRHGEEVYWVGGDLFATSDNVGTIVRYGPGTLRLEPQECP